LIDSTFAGVILVPGLSCSADAVAEILAKMKTPTTKLIRRLIFIACFPPEAVSAAYPTVHFNL
jgi:hypothetical protein